jgi:hypothetical protein
MFNELLLFAIDELFPFDLFMTSPHNPLDYNDEHLFVSEEE